MQRKEELREHFSFWVRLAPTRNIITTSYFLACLFLLYFVFVCLFLVGFCVLSQTWKWDLNHVWQWRIVTCFLVLGVSFSVFHVDLWSAGWHLAPYSKWCQGTHHICALSFHLSLGTFAFNGGCLFYPVSSQWK